MNTRAFLRRSLVAAGLSAAVIVGTAGMAEAMPRDCTRLQVLFDRIMANAEANGAIWSPLEWQIARQALGHTSDRMDALGC